MMATIDLESGTWRCLPPSLLATLTRSIGQGTLRFTTYKIRTRQQPESPVCALTRRLLHEGMVTIEGQRYRAEYVVNGWKSGPDQQIEVEAIPLGWEDWGDSSISAQELGKLTSAVVEAHQLVTELIIDL